MSGKDIKTICLKLESLHEKILKSKFAEQVYESEMMSLILAIGELEKQIPKKPIEDRYPWCICPNCRGSVYLKHIQEHMFNAETSYCEHCGQALDWSDTE